MEAQLTRATHNEEARQNALRDLRLLDTPPSESFDRLTRMASRLLGAPVSAISLTDSDRQFFKSKVGVDLEGIPREKAPCNYAIHGTEVFVVPDLLEDPRFADSPLAQAGIRFYAGAPLHTRQGHGLGTLCVVDVAPRQIDEDERGVLRDLAATVLAQIELQNTIGRVDATTGASNQHRLFEDLEDMARSNVGGTCHAAIFDLACSRRAGQGRRVLGASYDEALMRGTLDRLRPLVGNTASLYQVAPTRAVVVMSPTFGGDPEEYVERLSAAIRERIDCDGVPVVPAPTVGTCAFVSGRDHPRDVLRRLFNAVEDAAASEGGQAAYSQDLDDRNARTFALINDFKAALGADDQLSLVFQPRVDMRSGVAEGVEALIRWTHPTLGSVSPAEFVPAVEQTALARDLTDWVMARSFDQVADWQARGVALKVSINVSARNLDETDFTERLLRAAASRGVPATSVELEFTESAVAADGSRVLDQLTALRAAGMEVAIDDFGTGYSNLSYLQQLPATVLKIDRSFVKDLETSERDRKLVAMVIEMAHEFGYRVVAEGIETDAVYGLLRGWGCDEGQGYLMAKPMSPSAVEDWLASRVMRLAS